MKNAGGNAGRATPRVAAARTGRDVQRIAALARAIWTEHYVPLIGRGQVKYMLERFQSGPAIRNQIRQGCRYFLLMLGRRAAGYMAVAPDPAGKGMQLSKLYVRKGLRRRGVARAGVAHAEAICRAAGMARLWLRVNKGNESSICAYERMGFVRRGVLVEDIGEGFVMDDYRMEKRV